MVPIPARRSQFCATCVATSRSPFQRESSALSGREISPRRCYTRQFAGSVVRYGRVPHFSLTPPSLRVPAGTCNQIAPRFWYQYSRALALPRDITSSRQRAMGITLAANRTVSVCVRGRVRVRQLPAWDYHPTAEPSLRGSEPAVRTPVSGLREITCPPPNPVRS